MITIKEVKEHRERFRMITFEDVSHMVFMEVNIKHPGKIPKGSVLDQILRGGRTITLGDFNTCPHRFFKPRGEPEAYLCMLCGYGVMRKTEEGEK